ncbi:MAG: hypothetical protein HYY16_10070 [Planctomycetes bacterium]|nr:hypothetical protein [Planctomycetota bacterium]
MPKRLLFLIALFPLAAVGVFLALLVSRSRSDPTTPADVATPAEHDGTAPSVLDSLTVTRIFGRVALRSLSEPRWMALQEPVRRDVVLEVPNESVALISTAEGDDLLLRGGSRIRCWPEGDFTVASLEQGDIFIDASSRSWNLISSIGSLRVSDATCAVRLTPQAVHVAVARGTVDCIFEGRPLTIAEGEVAEMRGGNIIGSLSQEPSEMFSWVQSACDARDLLRSSPVGVSPRTRYRLSGRDPAGPILIREGDREVARWTSLPPRFAVEFTTTETATALSVEGRFDEGRLYQIASD